LRKLARPGERVRRAAHLGLLLPLLALGVVWSMASHPGSSPDDDFHLASIWCAWGTEASGCTKGGVERGRQLVSVPALDEAISYCVRRDTNESAACISDPAQAWPPLAASANLGTYPGGYYAAARLLASDDATSAILRMRVVAFMVCAALIVAAGLLLRSGDRWRAWWLLMLLSVPLTLSLFASNNPSGPTIAGCVAVAASSYRIVQQQDARISRVAVLIGLAGAVAAAASRPDGWQFTFLALGLGAAAGARGLRDLLDPRRLGALGLLGLVLAGSWLVQRSSPTLGYRPVEGGAAAAERGVSRLAVLLELPALYVGEFATRLGWLDLPMPAIVWGSTAVVLGGAITLGVTGLTPGRRLALLGAAALWVAVPFAMHLAVGYPVGAWVQPRYLLPLVLTTGLLLAVRRSGGSAWRRGQVAVLSGLAVVAHTWALHRSIRRSVTGLDVGTVDLSGGAQWWWPAGVLPGTAGLGPTAVWLIGSAAFALLVGAAAVAVLQTQGDPADPSDASEPAAGAGGRSDPRTSPTAPGQQPQPVPAHAEGAAELVGAGSRGPE
jgi:hypothetical protein